jgi:general secretion pathway protein D
VRTFPNVTKVMRGVSALLCGAVLTACTLPYEQLSLPRQIDPPAVAGNSGQPGTTRKGLPLSAPGSPETTEPRLYKGSGEFAGGNRSRTAESNPTWVADGPVGQAPIVNGAQTTKDGVAINLVGASVVEVAKTVLGDVLGVNYIVSEKVKATITMRTVRPVDKAGLLEIFEAVLRAEGATLVVEGGVYKIVPTGDATASGAPLRPRRTGNRQVAGVTTDIVPLRYVAPAEMERVLKSAAPQAGVLRVDSARNLIMISGTASELSSMRDLVNIFDVDWMRGMSFGLHPVETSDPEAIAQELDTIFANDKDSPTKGIVRFIGNRRLKSVLVISARPEYLQKAATWIARIDKASQATEKQVHVYHVQHRPVNELAQLLQKVYASSRGGGGSNFRPASSSGSGLADVPRSGESSSGSGPVAAPTITAPSQPGFGSASRSSDAASLTAGNRGTDGIGTGEAVVSSPAETTTRASGGSTLPPDDRSSGISVVADEPNNSLVITATASEYRRMHRILQTMDTTPNQVMLEATIAEVSLNDELKFGVRWFFQKGNQSVAFTDAAGVVGAAAGFSYFFNTVNVKAVINALSTVTDVNVLSSPTMMVLENKKAVLQVGDEVPILTQSAVTPLNAGGGGALNPIVNSVTYRNTGVILGITPRVGEDGRVLLEVEQEVSDVVDRKASGIDSPTIQQRRIKTTVTVRDGETIILAGLMQDKSTRNRDQIPIIGSIPFVGNAFKNKTDTINRTELLIAITPQVIRDDSQLSAATSEFRDSLNLATRPQRKTGPDTREQIDRIVR